MYFGSHPKDRVFYHLTNGRVTLEPAEKIFKWDSGRWGHGYSFSSLAFTFQRPLGTKYFDILHTYFCSPTPLNLGDVKESLGKKRNYWAQFTQAVKAIGFLEPVKGRGMYRLTETGEKYVSEVLSGRANFVFVAK